MMLQTLVLPFLIMAAPPLVSRFPLSVQASNDSESKSVFYTCPMHPNVKSDEPGECPICHMDLEKVEKEPAQEKKKTSNDPAEKKIRFYRNPMDPKITSPVPMKDNMGMDYIPVYEEEETQKKEVAGRAAIRLSHQQFANAQIRVIEVKKKDLKTSMRLSGGVYEGSRGKGTSALVYFRVPETFLSLIKAGQAVEVSSPAAGGYKAKGKVLSIDHSFDPFTRTTRATAQVKDDSGWLRTEVSVTAEVLSVVEDVIVVPKQSVVHTGPHDLVYVEIENGRFEPRIVKLGAKSDGEYGIQEGLTVGERIAEGPNFLIDSEARIRAAYD